MPTKSSLSASKVSQSQTWTPIDTQTHTNNAEGFFSPMRRGEIGHHHHVAGPYLIRFAQEYAWRETNKRVSNGDQVDRIVTLAMRVKKSAAFCGYWQRHAKVAA
jgi:hypothetical protein